MVKSGRKRWQGSGEGGGGRENDEIKSLALLRMMKLNH